MTPRLTRSLIALAGGTATLLMLSCGAGDDLARRAEVSVDAGDAMPVVDEAPRDPNEPPTDPRRLRSWTALRGIVFEDGGVRIDRAVGDAFQTPATREVALAHVDRSADLLALCRRNDAMGAARDAVLAFEQSPEAWRALGLALLSKRKDAQAALVFAHAVSLDGRDADLRTLYADALNRDGQRDASNAQLREAIAIDPGYAKAHARLAAQLTMLGDIEAAKPHADLAEQLGGTLPSVLRTRLDRGFPPAPEMPQAGAPTPPPVVGEQVRIDDDPVQARANETSASASDFNPMVAVAGWNDYRSDIRSFFSLTTDGGETWDEFVLRPPAQFQSSVEGDPMCAHDHRNGYLWAGAISFGFNGGLYIARLDPGQSEFNDPVMMVVDGGVDKGWLAAGANPFAPGNPNLTKLYCAFNFGLVSSDDLGDTWSGITSLGFGLGFLPRVGPDGELYILSWDFEDGIQLHRSFDGGDTILGPDIIATRMDVWGIDGTRFPGSFRVPPLNYMAVDPTSGDLYVVYFDTTQVVAGSTTVDLYFLKSTDRGANWTEPVAITQGDPGIEDHFFPWLEVDANGRIHMVYFNSRGSDQDSFGLIDAVYSYSDDAGETWSPSVLTPFPYNSEQDGNPGNTFIGDYLGLALAGDRAYPVYNSNQNGNADIFAHAIVTPPPGGDCPEDLDGSGTVDSADLNLVLGGFAIDDSGDIDGDGDTDSADLNLLLGLFGQDCP